MTPKFHVIRYDDGGSVTLDKPDRTAVILDVIPQMTEIRLSEHVIGFWSGCTGFYPEHVTSIDAVNQKFHVHFDGGDRRIESFFEIRLIPRE